MYVLHKKRVHVYDLLVMEHPIQSERAFYYYETLKAVILGKKFKLNTRTKKKAQILVTKIMISRCKKNSFNIRFVIEKLLIANKIIVLKG